MAKIIADFVADTIKPDNQLISLKFNDMSKEESAGFVGELRLLDINGA
ncbi:hypothetical protein [Methylomonas sp. HYX-M1]